MRSRFLPYRTDRDDTILNYYALPLVNLNTKDFGSNFITTKVNQKGTTVFVQVKEDIYPDNLYSNKIVVEEKIFLSYRVPEEHITNILLILEGKYSSLSPKAKQLIVVKSGLFYNHKASDGEIYTSKLIFALYKDEELIDYMYDCLKTNNQNYKPHDKKLYKVLKEGELTERITEEDFIENVI